MMIQLQKSEPGMAGPQRASSRHSTATSARAAAGGLSGVAQRANAGPHAASLASLQAVVAQRKCADCDRVKGWHAVQQMEGRVRPTTQLHGTGINDDASLEREADVMGARAARIGTAQRVAIGGRDGRVPLRSHGGVVQRAVVIEGDGSYTGAETIRQLAGAVGATEAEAALLANMGVDGLDHPFASWQDAVQFARAQVESAQSSLDPDVGGLSTGEQVDMEGLQPMGGQAVGSAPSLIFGTDGRNEPQVEAAVQAGYRRFDCAESYGNTAAVAAALRNSQLPRKDFEVIYKFSLRSGESEQGVYERLSEVAAQFGGGVDSLLIHNLDEGSDTDIRAAWGAMLRLRTEGTAREIGLGNIRPEHRALVGELKATGIDAIENSVARVLGDDQTAALVKSTGAKLYYYDVVKTAQEIGVNSKEGIQALTVFMSGFPSGGMILSSSSLGRMTTNLQDFGDLANAREQGEEQFDELETINSWKATANTCQESDADFALPEPVRAWLTTRLEQNDVPALRAEASQAMGSKAEWLRQQGRLPAESAGVRIPARAGLLKRFVGMPLDTVLNMLLGVKNCDWKPAIELVQVLVASLEDWDGFVKGSLAEIV